MYNNKWDKCHEYDSNNPTFSSSLLDKINQSLKNNPKNDIIDDTLSFFRATKDAKKLEDDKISSLRRTCLLEKWMEKKVSQKISKKTLLEEFDVQDTLFLGTTSTSSSSSEEFSINYTHPRQQKLPRMTCFAPPPMPKSVRTRPMVESKFIEEKSSSRSRAVKMYSNLKNLKQPISPGVRLTSFINSLFANKDNNDSKKKAKKNKNKDKISSNNNIIIIPKSEKVKPTSYSACTTPTSYSRSCFSKNNNSNKEKRTVRFCPVSVILDEESRPCGQKPVFEDGYERISSSKLSRSLSKRYEELKINSNSNSNININMKLEKVALDLLSGYVNDGNYGGNYGVNYGGGEDNYDYDDDGLSCSSSDLFELDHLSLIGDELPVYETTQFNPKLH